MEKPFAQLDISTALHQLRELHQHPGWQHYTKMLEVIHEGQYQRLLKAGDPTELARLAGGLAVLEECSVWLPRQIDAFERQQDAQLKSHTPK